MIKEENVQSNKEKAEEYKLIANRNFAENKYDVAVEYYSKAIEMDDCNPTYYCNRAITRLKMELYGGALEDANKAIEIDPDYTKALYRRSCAQWFLGNFKAALSDLSKVRSKFPTDNFIAKKFIDMKREFKRYQFEKAIHFEQSKVSLESHIGDIDAINVEDSYKGPILPDDVEVTDEFVNELIDFLKDQKKLHTKYLYQLLIKVKNIFAQEKNIVNIEISQDQKLTVAGDVHGQYYDFLNIFELNGRPGPKNMYLFNGDFVDRGSFSVECAVTLLAYKCLYPQYMFISRGNHETEEINNVYGFKSECKAKYSLQAFKAFTIVFEHIPLGYSIMDKILVVHGGLFSEPNVTIDQLQQIDRFTQPDDQLMKELLWSDPSDKDGITPSYRGIGVQFGPDITRDFCKRNNLKCIIRSHEMKNEGYEITHGGQCITVFSAPNYFNKGDNKGAYIVIDHLLNMKYHTFEAVPHPNASNYEMFTSFR